MSAFVPQGPSDGRRVAVLASGSGRSLDNLATLSASGELDATIALLVCDKRKAGVLAVAERHGVEAVVLRPRDFDDASAFGAAVFEAVERAQCRLVVLAGFLRHLPVPDAWHGHVINIHPSLLPKHGGKGYYGDRVHAAVLAAGDAESGCTVHYVDEVYDHGPHLVQRRVPVEPDDDAHSLASRVFAEECRALPEAVRLHLDGEVDLERARRGRAS